MKLSFEVYWRQRHRRWTLALENFFTPEIAWPSLPGPHPDGFEGKFKADDKIKVPMKDGELIFQRK